ncbi:MAG: Surface antigen [Syntrophaceae bacterium PtaU1.Bin231]|nr:MAG: Surface antigen [Syntrophaceae bacterium PtaU1.Bin231]
MIAQPAIAVAPADFGVSTARCPRVTTSDYPVISATPRKALRGVLRGAFPCAAASVLLLIGFCPPVATAADSACGQELSRSAAAAEKAVSFRSSEDGWLDASEFLDQTYGFLPVVVPITEPAVGYGAFGALAFIDRPAAKAEDGFGRPNITLVGGLLTENDTRGAMAGDLRHWMGDRLQTLAGVFRASINLDFYGIGRDDSLNSNPLAYNLETSGAGIRAKYRLVDSRFWAGLGYAYATTEVSFDGPLSAPGLRAYRQESSVGGMVPSISYDSRDNLFTPGRGTYADASVGLFSHTLGGDDEFQRVSLTAIHYVPLGQKLHFGVCGGAVLSFGDVPFYLRPFVQLRGAPIMRYQGDETAQAEAELRWQFWQRLSLVGFAGAGAAWNDRERFDNATTLVTGGAGFRYELARKHGLHVGLDAAVGPAGPAVYVQFGSAWIRP